MSRQSLFLAQKSMAMRKCLAGMLVKAKPPNVKAIRMNSLFYSPRRESKAKSLCITSKKKK